MGWVFRRCGRGAGRGWWFSGIVGVQDSVKEFANPVVC